MTALGISTLQLRDPHLILNLLQSQVMLERDEDGFINSPVLSCSAAPGLQEGHTGPGPRTSHLRLLRACCSSCPSHAARAARMWPCPAWNLSRHSSRFSSTNSHLVCPGSHRTSLALWNNVGSLRNVGQLASILPVKCGLGACLIHLQYSGTFLYVLGPHKVEFSQKSWIRLSYTLWISQPS